MSTAVETHSSNRTIKTLFATGFALTAFAANSVLCRAALGDSQLDAASFTAIRLGSGALVLVLLTGRRQKRISDKAPKRFGSWFAAFLLFLYASTFSFAYISLDTATGALILFGSVQLTMLTTARIKGEHLGLFEWSGAGLAFAGFVYLILPQLSSPSWIGLVLMTLAGIGWGGYTLCGKGSKFPLNDTSVNFSRSLFFLIPLIVVSLRHHQLSTNGILYAILSGGFASGLGYTIWYMALNGLSATQAAVAQLLVPVIAALGGVVFVGEAITQRLVVASIVILGGMGLVVLGRGQDRASSPQEIKP